MGDVECFEKERNSRSFPSQIHTSGCIQRIQLFVEQNLYVVAGIALGVALMQLLGEF